MNLNHNDQSQSWPFHSHHLNVDPPRLRPHEVASHSASSSNLVTVAGLGVGVARVVLELGG